MTDAIKPPWAISLWSNADHIYAELPNPGGKTSHVIKVSNDPAGISKLLVLAKYRDASSKLGNKGDPTQQQIESPKYDESMVRRTRERLKFTPEQRMGARVILRKMGLI